jgi:RNA polymerase sigma-70 factor (ECF subfamily)
MTEREWLAEQFEDNRSHLRAVAYRMLGSLAEAEDAVQESWLRVSRSDMGGVDNLGGWLTTVVARICLDQLRARHARQEEPLETSLPERVASHEREVDPEQEALLAESVGMALLVVLDTLTPAERLAFVLHDIFAMPFDEIARVVERSEAATRQLASRARRRVRGGATVRDPDVARQREVVNAFLSASRAGDFDALLNILDPEVVFRADHVLISAGAAAEVHGAAVIARQFTGRAQGARAALVNGSVGLVVAQQGRLFLVLQLTITNGKIVAIDAIGEPSQLHQLQISVLDE